MPRPWRSDGRRHAARRLRAAGARRSSTAAGPWASCSASRLRGRHDRGPDGAERPVERDQDQLGDERPGGAIYHCMLHNIWQRSLKGVKVPEPDRETHPPGADAASSICLFYNDRPKELADDPADTPQDLHGN